MNLSEEEFETEKAGDPTSDTYRVFFKRSLPSSAASVYISPFHDIPLYSQAGPNVYHMLVEIPRWTNAIYEIALNEHFNPIKQNTSGSLLKFDRNVFPFHGFIWNYGSLPQTWVKIQFTTNRILI
jgi:inorganic pyrophosphatase